VSVLALELVIEHLEGIQTVFSGDRVISTIPVQASRKPGISNYHQKIGGRRKLE
jgi:hypothetical protein